MAERDSMNSKTHRSFVSTQENAIVMQNGSEEDTRFNKINEALHKLNTQLLKYQDDLMMRREDPLILNS